MNPQSYSGSYYYFQIKKGFEQQKPKTHSGGLPTGKWK